MAAAQISRHRLTEVHRLVPTRRLHKCQSSNLQHRRSWAPVGQRSSTALGALKDTRSVNSFHTLSDGKRIEVVFEPAASSSGRPPLVFVHGSYHSAWCWQEKYLPYFSNQGYSGYSLSLKAQGQSDSIDAKVAGTLASHAADLASFIASLPEAPVVVAHSFGGLILQKYLLGRPDGTPNPPLAGAAFLASVPPSGNKQLVGRFLKRDPLLSFKVTWGFITKSFARDRTACQELFFSPDIDGAELDRYQQLLALCSPIRLLDLQDMNSSVPLPPPPANHPPAFVMGGLNDSVVDKEAVEELAAYYGVQPVLLPNTAHDVMLDTRWEAAAQKLKAWLDTLPGQQ